MGKIESSVFSVYTVELFAIVGLMVVNELTS